MAFTKEQLIDFAADRIGRIPNNAPDGELAKRALYEIALASLTAEPVSYIYKDNLHTDARFSLHTRFGNWSQEDINEYEITEIPLYTTPPAPVVPYGYALVPVEPTESMIIAGFEAELREEFRDPDAWEAYEAMSGCEQAALRAKWCWAAMVAAATQQEAE